jgi:hypothetical protein
MNAFRDVKINTPGMTAGIIAVYYALLDMNNQSKWSEEFDVDFGYMLSLAKVDKTTYYKALAFLKEIGCISTYTKGVNHYSRAKVSLCLLYENSIGKPEGNSETNHASNHPSNRNNIETVNTEKENEISFDQFWNLYDKKTGKDKALKKWTSLKDSEREIILSAVSSYIESTPDKKFRKDPLTYLNGRHWEDEIISDKKESLTNQPGRYSCLDRNPTAISDIPHEKHEFN